MSDLDSQNYFDKFLDKAVGRAVVTDEERQALSTAWHRHEKTRALQGFFFIFFVLSGFGILVGAFHAVP